MNNMVGNGFIKIMKGSITTDFSDLTQVDSRSSDVLLTLDPSSIVSTVGDRQVTVSASHTAATAGTAAWFWWYSPTDLSSSSTIEFQMAGTVGTSGTDLVIGDTALVQGENYRLTNQL